MSRPDHHIPAGVPPCIHDHARGKLVCRHFTDARISILSCMYCGWIDTEAAIEDALKLNAESSAAAPVNRPEQAWLLSETWRDKSVHHEGIALTHEAKDAFMRGDYEQGHSRTAIPYKIVAAVNRDAASSVAPCEHEWQMNMIQMPQGYSKPVSTTCRKCGAFRTNQTTSASSVATEPEP